VDREILQGWFPAQLIFYTENGGHTFSQIVGSYTPSYIPEDGNFPFNDLTETEMLGFF
jgi:hypothetical protein